MFNVAKSVAKYFSLLLLGAIIGFALLSWFLNHSQCEGLTWDGEMGLPLIKPSDSLNCMRTGPMLEYQGIWRRGFELNEFYLTDSNWTVINPKQHSRPLVVPELSEVMIYEQLGIDPYTKEPQAFKISFKANLMTNYLQGHSAYRNHYDVRVIDNISVYEGSLPTN